MKYKLKKDTIIIIGGIPIMCHKGFEVDVVQMRRGYGAGSFYVDNYFDCHDVEIEFNPALKSWYPREILGSFEIVEEMVDG